MENGRILKEVVRIAIYVKAIFSFMHVVLVETEKRKKIKIMQITYTYLS